MPKAYGYGAAAGAPAALLDFRGLLPAGRAVEFPRSGPAADYEAPPPAPISAPSSAASCYGRAREGGLTASGEVYDGEALAAAHPDMPLSSLALVRNTQNGKEAIVRVNDRPRGRAIEFTPAAARALGISGACTAPVIVTRLGAAPYAAKSRPPGQQVSASAPAPLPQLSSAAFLVQIGAFAQRDNAEAAREQVREAGPVTVEPAIVGGASLFRVRLGPWSTREQAERARAAAAELGFPGAKLLLP